MVGKGVELKTSRIFHQCYLKCCKLQNLTPLGNVLPMGNGKVLDFCVDRIKYQDWPPILNALSCDLSLHSLAVRFRQPVKTVLENIDCERLAKTVNKRAVILTNFMLSNFVEAISQLLSNTTLLTSLLLEGLPLKIPYFNPLCSAILGNSSLQYLYLPRCLIGDAGCLAVCKAVRCLPNILTLDLTGCEVTPVGAGYLADLIKYQKINRYSENWVHTLRYRLPELDTMAGLRRITLCNNPLGDTGANKLLEVLSDDLWIKALDIQNCGLTEQCAIESLQILQSNTALSVLDMRSNAAISSEMLSKIRAALRENDRSQQRSEYSWLGSHLGSMESRSVKSNPPKNGVIKERIVPAQRGPSCKYATKTNLKKEKDYAELLEEQLQEEIAHRQQLEELNQQLVDQMKMMKQNEQRMWTNGNAQSSGSEQSFNASVQSLSSSSGSSVPIDQNTLSYIQQAFKDIYSFIKNNQCNGKDCLSQEQEVTLRQLKETVIENVESDVKRIGFVAKKAQSVHKQITETKVNKMTKSAHVIGDHRDLEMNSGIIEKKMGDTKNSNEALYIMDELNATKAKISGGDNYSPCGSMVSGSSDTLVSPRRRRLNPREALYSSSESDSD